MALALTQLLEIESSDALGIGVSTTGDEDCSLLSLNSGAYVMALISFGDKLDSLTSVTKASELAARIEVDGIARINLKGLLELVVPRS